MWWPALRRQPRKKVGASPLTPLSGDSRAPPHAASDRATELASLTLDLGLQSEQMYLDWLHRSIERVHALLKHDTETSTI